MEDGERNSRILRIRARGLAQRHARLLQPSPITITAECNQDYVAPDGSSVYEYQLKTYVNVESSDSDSVTDFYINKYEVDHEDIQYGDQFNFTVNVVNTGSEDLENLQVRLDGFSTDGLTLVDDTDVKYINVDAGEEAQLTYRMEASERIGTGRYPLTVGRYLCPQGDCRQRGDCRKPQARRLPLLSK